MGCFESREESKPGQISFINKDNWEAKHETEKLVAVDCSVNSNDGKVVAAEAYKFQRIPNAHFLGLEQFMDRTAKPVVSKVPTLEQMTAALKAIGVDLDTKVVCYDNADGLFACRAAVLISAVGVKDVRVLDCKFGTWNVQSKTELAKVTKHTGTAFEFKFAEADNFATAADVDKIVAGNSSV